MRNPKRPAAIGVGPIGTTFISEPEERPMRTTRSFALAVALTGLAAAAQVPPALAANAFAATRTAAPHAAAPTLGMAILSAYVDQSSNPPVGAGVVGASRLSDGRHFVVFNRSVEGCIYAGTIVGSLTGFDLGLVATIGMSGTLNGVTYYGVRVDTADPNGGPSDLPFQLLVFCSK
jgi:hypothetical protein